MANDLIDKIPEWLKNELRSSAQKAIFLRKDEAAAHLGEARRHLEEAWKAARGDEPPNGPQTPLRKEGEI